MASKTREKLIEVARQLFVKKGVAHTTMNDIASASSKGRRTIYTYFKNKKEIYNAVLETESDRLVDSLRKIVDSEDGVEKRLRKFLLLRLSRYVMPASSTNSLKSWMSLDGRRVIKIQQLARDKENAMLVDLISEGCRNGVFKKDRCALVKSFISVAIASIDMHMVTVETPEARERALCNFVEFILSDILVKKCEE